MSEVETTLFRQDAIKHSAPTLFGGTVVKSGKTVTVLALSAFMLVIGLILVLFFGTYERRERVPGYIAPTAGLVRVEPFRAGVITDLEVTEGQEVEDGQPLFSISSLRSMADGVDVDAAQVTALELERANIESRITREGELAKTRSQDARRRIAEIQSQSESVQGQQELARQHAELLRRDVARLESLRSSGHVSDTLLDERRGELLNAQQNVAALGRELERLQADIGALEADLVQNPLQLGARQDELRARLLEVDRMLTEAEVQRKSVVRAPVAGRVTTVVAHPGLSVTPDQAMLAILPTESRMRAELLVPTHAAGLVQSGQKVRLRYDAFPYQKFGVYRGTVKSLSRTVLNPEDQVGPVRLQVPAYRVIATLDAETVTAYGEAIPLRPGLTLQADVVRERMRLIEWIFDPVRSAVKGL